MKTKIFFLALVVLLYSCSSDENNNDDNGNGNNNNTFEITFQNSSFTGSVLVTYTDGSTQTGQFENGKCKLPKTQSGDKTIASLQPQNQNIILIGRKEGTPIDLNYNNGTLLHRVAVGGFVPIGSFAEFQLINNNTSTLSNSYKLEADIDFMSMNWMSIGNITNKFTGNFDGDDYEIFNLKLSTANSNNNYALFDFINGSEIKNIVIRTANSENISSIVFNGINTTISNCKNYANIEGSGIATIISYSVITDCKNYGNLSNGSGIVGQIDRSTIKNCQNYGLISSQGLFHSGIAGNGVPDDNIQNGVEIYNCSNIGNINSIGGSGICSNAKKISGSFNRGNISGGGAGASGIGIALEITNCYNTGDISSDLTAGGISSDLRTYKLVGSCSNFTQYYPTIKNCYNIGKINGVTFSGSIIGKIDIVNGINNTYEISNNYWKDDLTDSANFAIGGFHNYNTCVSNTYGNGFNSGCSIFSSPSWPSSSQGWNIGNGTNNAYWKSLGSWNNGNPTYPKLWFEE